MSDRLVQLTSFGNVEEAHLAKNALEAEGIRVFLDGEASGVNLWHLGVAIGGIKLLVPEEEIPRAHRVLEGEEEEGVPPPASEGGPPDTRITSVERVGEARPEVTNVEQMVQQERPTGADAGAITSDLPEQGEGFGAEGDDESEEDAPQFSPGEAMATRAFRAAVFGFFFVPITLYSLWVLIGLLNWDGELSPSAHRKMVWALIFNGACLLLYMPFLAVLFRGVVAG